MRMKCIIAAVAATIAVANPAASAECASTNAAVALIEAAKTMTEVAKVMESMGFGSVSEDAMNKFFKNDLSLAKKMAKEDIALSSDEICATPETK